MTFSLKLMKIDKMILKNDLENKWYIKNENYELKMDNISELKTTLILHVVWINNEV